MRSISAPVFSRFLETAGSDCGPAEELAAIVIQTRRKWYHKGTLKLVIFPTFQVEKRCGVFRRRTDTHTRIYIKQANSCYYTSLNSDSWEPVRSAQTIGVRPKYQLNDEALDGSSLP